MAIPDRSTGLRAAGTPLAAAIGSLKVQVTMVGAASTPHNRPIGALGNRIRAGFTALAAG
jgi:hypothetical protein